MSEFESEIGIMNNATVASVTTVDVDVEENELPQEINIKHLVVDVAYDAHIIKKIDTGCEKRYVVDLDSFLLYLPKSCKRR